MGEPQDLIAKSEMISRQAVNDWAKRHDYLDFWRERRKEVGYDIKGVNFVDLVLGRLGRLFRDYSYRLQEESKR